MARALDSSGQVTASTAYHGTKRLILISSRYRSKIVKVSPYGAPQDGLQISITLLGTKTGAKRVVTELIQEARKHAIAKDKSKTVVSIGDEVYPLAVIEEGLICDSSIVFSTGSGRGQQLGLSAP